MIVVAASPAMPVWARIAAGILVPASAISAAIAVEFIKYRSGWQLLVPALIPPLIAAYALWARLPQLHRVLPPVLTGIAVWGGVLALTLAPMPDYIGQRNAAARLRAAAKLENEVKVTAEEQRRRDNLARFQQLTDASPLWEWAAFFGKDNELDKDAVAAARKLSDRQADAEGALRRGMGFRWPNMSGSIFRLPPACEGRVSAAGRRRTHRREGSVRGLRVIQQNFSPYLEAVGGSQHRPTSRMRLSGDRRPIRPPPRATASSASWPGGRATASTSETATTGRWPPMARRSARTPIRRSSSTAAATSITTWRRTIARLPTTARRSA
jgi:hypothetical protein